MRKRNKIISVESVKDNLIDKNVGDIEQKRRVVGLEMCRFGCEINVIDNGMKLKVIVSDSKMKIHLG